MLNIYLGLAGPGVTSLFSFFKHFQNSEDSGTIVPDESGEESGTMIQHSTLVSNSRSATSEIESNLGTMVINEDEDEDASETMKRKDKFCLKLVNINFGELRLVKVSNLLFALGLSFYIY